MTKKRRIASRACARVPMDSAAWLRFDGIAGVYAIAAYGCCAVKIGWSGNIQKRLRHLSCGMPFGLAIIGHVPGGTAADEQRFHRELREWHLRGEWFAWTNAVREFVESHFVSCETPVSDAIKSGLVCDFPFVEYEEKDEAEAAIAAAYNQMGPRERQFVSEWISGSESRPMTVEEFSSLALSPSNRGRSPSHTKMLIAKVSYRFQQAASLESDESLARMEAALGDAVMEAHSPGMRVDMDSSRLAPNGIGSMMWKESSNG